MLPFFHQAFDADQQIACKLNLNKLTVCPSEAQNTLNRQLLCARHGRVVAFSGSHCFKILCCIFYRLAKYGIRSQEMIAGEFDHLVSHRFANMVVQNFVKEPSEKSQ